MINNNLLLSMEKKKQLSFSSILYIELESFYICITNILIIIIIIMLIKSITT